MSFRTPAAHAAPKPASRALLRAALVLSAAGAALSVGAGASQAAQLPGAGGALTGAVSGLAESIGPVKHLRLDPLAGTPVDLLTNGVGTQIADFKPIGTRTLTQPITDGDSLSQLPLIGPLTALIPG
ncbi:hypothetical protein POF50_012460 [Streptomyces sp. SL13]|jgi:hypothetical protein|uniref:Secreted protein n=1 Tax=Streptantibioticus silvisoli TaxID=2705255 RepID=A0AA90H4E3_9ACTN|nr:hypothetical protein [Streptantibioticus silvisoli]MDI5967365.1 hypothetical protein [Streptantibioticus silvisoli]MDI5970142.1 hypothetical protein [Streptantibioticus silvisoli]